MGSDELLSGKRLGRFTLVRRIALGGMAEIWLANDPEEETRRAGGGARPPAYDRTIEEPEGPPLIALKVLLSPYAKDPTFHSMFVDEVNIASRLTHENIVQVHGAWELEGHLVQAMELVDGKDLRRVLSAVARAGTRFPIPLALLVAREMARALAYAHMKRGEDGKPLDIVHRDVSPHNVMITRAGGVKVLDFGIARAAERLTRTRTGVIKGKVAYMAPEQASALAVTHRTDIFAAGIVLWEMLAMQRLFKADSDAMILERVIRAEVPSILEINPEVPKDAATLIEQMLAQRPAMRPESMKTVENALTRIMLRHYPEDESSTAALARWVEPFLEQDRTKELGAPEEPAPPPPEPADDPSAMERTQAMLAGDRVGASGSHPLRMDAAGEESTLPDVNAEVVLPVELANQDPTAKVDAPSISQLGIETLPVRTRDIIGENVPQATPATPTPETPPGPVDRVRLPTKSEVLRAVDNVATVPMVVDREAQLAASLHPRVFGRFQPERPPENTPTTEPPEEKPAAADPTLLGDLSPDLGTETPKVGVPMAPPPHEISSDEHNFEPVRIALAEHVSQSVPAVERESTPPLVTPAPDDGGARIYKVMFGLAMVVIVLLLVLLLMKD